jgi:hypothetical protein
MTGPTVHPQAAAATAGRLSAIGEHGRLQLIRRAGRFSLTDKLPLGPGRAHDELSWKEAEIPEVERRIGFREIEAQKESAESVVWDAEYDVMEAKPATTAGAVALMRFVAELMGGFFPDDDEHEHYVVAIRNVADLFEGVPRHEQEARKTEDPQSADGQTSRVQEGGCPGLAAAARGAPTLNRNGNDDVCKIQNSFVFPRIDGREIPACG